jgi:nucleotide-binding universal stress UspA family protein
MNDITSIAVHLDGAAGLPARLTVARALAARFGAQLEGLYAVNSVVTQYPYAFTGEAAAASQLLAWETEERQRVKAVLTKENHAHRDWPHLPWAAAQDEPVRAFIELAWAADLLVLAQHQPDATTMSGVAPDFAASVLIGSGKPGLVLPYVTTASAANTVGKNILVAWKATPESARALGAALPWLQRADRVHLASWDEAPPNAASAVSAPLPVERWLKHHGVNATLHPGGPATGDLGELLLSLAADVQADLLVMGCYGHGRAREWAWGGVTRTVLKSMTLPTLMVH